MQRFVFLLSLPAAKNTQQNDDSFGSYFISNVDIIRTEHLWILLSFILLLLLIFNYWRFKKYKQKHNNDSNEVFRKMYNNSPVMMHSIDMEGNLIYVNNYWLKILGYQESEVIGKKSSDFFAGELHHNYPKVFQKLLNTGKLQDYEAQMQCKNGSLIYVLLTAELSYENGKPVRSYTILMNITERKNTVKALQESKHKLDSIMQNATEAIFVLQNAKIQYANNITSKILGYSIDELKIHPFQKILFPEDRPWVMNKYEKRMQGEEVPQQYSLRVVRKDQKVIWAEVNAIYLLWDNKPAVLVFLFDISERKKHEDILIKQAWDLYEQNEKLELLNQELRKKNTVLDEHQSELTDYADELKSALEEVDDKTRRIEQAHKDMMDSIEYARLIQDAVLKTSDELSDLFEHFIIFKPQTIVSGDFYFFKRIKHYQVFAVGDCTGHGVPGGFLTMFGVNLLREVLASSDLLNPAEVLEKMRWKVKNVFQFSRHHDGMDISLAVYDMEHHKLHFSGANLSAILCSGKTLQKLHTVRNPIGFYVEETPFESITLDINSGDTLYIYSDGFKDQFGGPENRKYQFRRFRELISTYHNEPMQKQKKRYEQEHQNWKQDEAQVDDITVIGIRFA